MHWRLITNCNWLSSGIALDLKSMPIAAEQLPIAELRRRGHIPETNSKIDLVRLCLKFFGIDSPESLRLLYGCSVPAVAGIRAQ